MKRNLMLVGTALTLSSCSSLLGPAQPEVTVTVLGVNDFHGNLLPTSFRIPDPADRTKTVTVQAGGIEAIGGVLAQTRQENPNTVFVGVGDMTGASPLISGLLRDEPTILALSGLGMAVNVVGNHEFDYGYAELQATPSCNASRRAAAPRTTRPAPASTSTPSPAPPTPTSGRTSWTRRRARSPSPPTRSCRSARHGWPLWAPC